MAASLGDASLHRTRLADRPSGDSRGGSPSGPTRDRPGVLRIRWEPGLSWIRLDHQQMRLTMDKHL